MTDEVKKFVKELHDEGCKGCIHMKIGRCGHIMMGLFCRTKLHDAANLIESLSAELEQVKQERDGLSIMLTSATSAAETYKHELDAAVEDLREISIECRSEDVCFACKHEKEPCEICNFEWRGVKED